jgi:hypothetical protein
MAKYKEFEVSQSSSIISLKNEGGGWQLSLNVNDTKMYELTSGCNTCEFFFERTHGQGESLTSKEFAELMEEGITTLDPQLIEITAQIMPKGKYLVYNSEIRPKLTIPFSETDYFANEQVEVWDKEPFSNLPRFPKTEYYRFATQNMTQLDTLFEFALPLNPTHWLDEDRLAYYTHLFEIGQQPTALAISILDVRGPATSEYEHHCLAHFLLDGHHKVYAAAQLNKPLRLLSFVSLDYGVSTLEEKKAVIGLL